MKKKLRDTKIGKFLKEKAPKVLDAIGDREVELAKANRFDFMFNLTGLVGLSCFAFLVYAIVYLEVPEHNKEIWIHLIGVTEGIVLSIFGYFYGSSASRRK